MPQRIQKRPLGLLSFLGLQGTGISPPDLSDVVVPTLNVEHFYAAVALETVFASNTLLSAVDTGATIVIPDGESWRLVALSFNSSAFTVGAVVSIALTVIPQGGITTTVRGPVPMTVTAAGDIDRGGLFVPQPFVLAPGSQLNAVLTKTILAGTATIAVVALMQRLRS